MKLNQTKEQQCLTVEFYYLAPILLLCESVSRYSWSSEDFQSFADFIR